MLGVLEAMFASHPVGWNVHDRILVGRPADGQSGIGRFEGYELHNLRVRGPSDRSGAGGRNWPISRTERVF